MSRLPTTSSQLYTTGVLSVVSAAGIPGDYNQSAADYTRYRNALGTNSMLPNDTTPGSVTTADLAVWQTNFGQSASDAATSAVPEPSAAAVLLLLGGFLLRNPRF